jgi:hypothetical protein
VHERTRVEAVYVHPAGGDTSVRREGRVSVTTTLLRCSRSS